MEHARQNWTGRKTPTLKDVAREVGVSEATASVVLNGAKSGTRVSSERRQEILDAAARIGYRPNSVARALQAGKNHRIGLYSGRTQIDARNMFFAEVLGGMCGAAREQETNLVLHASGQERSQLEELVSGAALDGLILHASHDDPIIPLLPHLSAPAVTIADAIPGLHAVCVDDRMGGTLQATHLHERGHRHVLYKQTRYLAQSALDRMGAFLLAAQRFGIEVTIRYEASYEEPFEAFDLDLVTRGENRATAIVGWNDRAASMGCDWLASHGIDVPSEVAVVGFDGFESFLAPRHSLTTIRAPWAQVGRTAVNLVSQIGQGEKVPLVTNLPVELVLGSTT